VSLVRFNCPYCCSDIPGEASVCSQCTRDLALIKPLALRIQSLSDEVVQLKELLAQQAQTLTQLKTPSLQAAAQTYAASMQTSADTEFQESSMSPKPSWRHWIGIMVLTIASIGLCHWILLFIYDAPPLFLRLLTITWPAVTGYYCARRNPYGGITHFLSACVVSVLSVGLMLAITSHIDGVSLLPSNHRDWRETLEYTAAIGLSFFTGYLTHLLVTRLKRQRYKQISLRILMARDAKGQFKITEISNQVQGLITATAPLVSAAAALYSGLKAFTGS